MKIFINFLGHPIVNQTQTFESKVNHKIVDLIGYKEIKEVGVLICNQQVVGSNPIASSILNPYKKFILELLVRVIF